MVEKNTAHENKFKNFIEKGKNFLGNAKLTLSSLYNQTKVKLIDTINIISTKISKLKKQTEKDIAELFSTTGTESQHGINTDEMNGKTDDISDMEKNKSLDTDGNEFVDDVEGVVDSNGEKEGSTNEGLYEEGSGIEEDYSFDFFEDDIDNAIKQEIVKQIMEKEGKREYYAQGSEGIILKIEINDNKGDKKEFLVAKKRYDHKTQNECKLHEAVQNLLPIGDNTVRVPELKAKISGLNGENYIIMEFINGKTIYQMTIEEILRKNGFGSFNFENDKEATNCFCKFLGVERNTKENLNLLDKKYESLCKELKIFDSKTGKKYEKAMREFIKKMHDEGIYHRDLHQKNIIVGDDGKLYIIDFGKSLQLPQDGMELSKKEIYEEQVGELTGSYVYDESGVSIIKGLTKDENDEENEKWHENFIKKEKELTNKINSGDSIIKQFNELPKGFRIKMERNQFLKEVEKEAKSSKRIPLNTFLYSKGDELMIYLFAQSLENIENTLKEISERTKTCENEINRQEKDPRAEQPLFRKKYITPHEKKLKGMSSLKNKLEKLKKYIKNPDNK